MSDNKEEQANQLRDHLHEGATDNRQEQNWRLMTILQIPWHHANQIEDEADRKFLLNKATEVEGFMQQQQMQQQQMQQQQQQQGTDENPSPSPILAPN